MIFTHLYWRGPETFGWGVGRVKAVAPSLPAAGSVDLVDRCGVASWRWSRAMGRARTVSGYQRETEVERPTGHTTVWRSGQTQASL